MEWHVPCQSTTTLRMLTEQRLTAVYSSLPFGYPSRTPRLPFAYPFDLRLAIFTAIHLAPMLSYAVPLPPGMNKYTRNCRREYYGTCMIWMYPNRSFTAQGEPAEAALFDDGARRAGSASPLIVVEGVEEYM